MVTDVKILRVKKFPLYDVFQGEGWDGWSRILVKGTKAVLIAGAHLSTAQLRSLLSTILTDSKDDIPNPKSA